MHPTRVIEQAKHIENKVVVLFPGASKNSLPLLVHPFRTFLQALQLPNTYLLEALHKEYGLYPL
jgi:hypothetical protein